MRELTFIALLICLTTLLYGQKNLYLGFEAGANFDKYEWFDSGDKMRNIPLFSQSFGVNVGYRLNDYFSIETGAILKQYKQGYSYSLIGSRTGFTQAGMNSVQVPFRLNARAPIVKDKLFFTGTIGWHHCYNLDKASGSAGIRASGGDYTLISDENYNNNLLNNFGLLETGVGLEWRVLKNAYLRFSASYFTGFQRVTQSDVVYSVNDGPQTNATRYSKGDYASYSMGLRFPIGTLGSKKK